ncbi:glycosyltransferase family 2 protein [Flavobacterium pectinovorum]|uniref:Glycosyl transferase family 2 n=1 Tax=Flavobacterium pectinovorum TaxID=29533 RepID=A0AB36P5K4_9FLAO|nr:glycosyltransferase family 2 protein [Flavobacterium pectinovorum]OXB07634.1 glycosyl transferase family 2 [Flavobacterium pectinovorum]SHM74628.1 Glycosyltransferase, GT2 family [Flavobacterium pectinovorum]
MKFSLIICTYMRPEPLLNLLHSVQNQILHPDEILIIDGSVNGETQKALNNKEFQNLKYFLVSDMHRGLTKQRNFGISKVAEDSEIVCFLDDDTVLESDYFAEIIKTFQTNNDVSGVGGVAINEYKWKLQEQNILYNKNKFYLFEGYYYKEGLRNVMRNYLGLASNLGPGKMPDYSHGRTCGFPMTGKTYEVDLLIGMSMSFRKSVFDKINFSRFFEGYGLYEDADFSLRALEFGKNVINTKAHLSHFHAESGRPNKYKYGIMVVRNGWYVWRIKNPTPGFNDRFKWNAIIILLTVIRLSNVITEAKKKEAFTEAMGRIVGWWSLLFNKPKFTK